MTALFTILFRCVLLARDVHRFSGVSQRTMRHTVIRMFMLIAKLFGVMLLGLLFYHLLQEGYRLTFPFNGIRYVLHRRYTNMSFGWAAAALAIPVCAALERLILKIILKDEYMDYAFWDDSAAAIMRTPSGQQALLENAKTLPAKHYAYMFVCVIWCVVFALCASDGGSSMCLVCDNGIYDIQSNGYYCYIPFDEVARIEPAVDRSATWYYYVSAGNQREITVDTVAIPFISEQSGIPYEPFPDAQLGTQKVVFFIDTPSK